MSAIMENFFPKLTRLGWLILPVCQPISDYFMPKG